DLTATGDIGDVIGDNLWRVPDMNDPDVSSSSINKQGDSEFLTVSARDDMFIGGESVKEALAEAVQPALLVTDSRFQSQIRGPYSVDTGIWRWGQLCKAGHRYVVQFSFRLTTTGAWFDVYTIKNFATPPGTPTQPSVGDTKYMNKRIVHPSSAQTFWYMTEFPYNPGNDEDTAWLLGLSSVSNSSNPWTVREFHVKMIDYGIGPDNTGYATTGGAAETPPTRWMDKYFYFTKHRTWSQFGR